VNSKEENYEDFCPNDLQEFGLRHHFPARKYKKTRKWMWIVDVRVMLVCNLSIGSRKLCISEMIFIYISVRYFFSLVLGDVLVVLETSNYVGMC